MEWWEGSDKENARLRQSRMLSRLQQNVQMRSADAPCSVSFRSDMSWYEIIYVIP